MALNFFFLLMSQIRYGNLALVAHSLSTCGPKVTIDKFECFPDLPTRVPLALHCQGDFQVQQPTAAPSPPSV